MKNKILNLSQIMDLTRWQKLQDSLALTTGMAMITVDYKGNPVTKHSSCQEFCTHMRGNSEMAKHCQRCDSRGGLEAVRLNKPYIYKCHYGIIDIAIPIIVEAAYVGAIMAGQIKLQKDSDSDELEQITSYKGKITPMEDAIDLQYYYEKLPIMSYEKVKITTAMLDQICHYIIAEAVDKYTMIDIYENAIRHTSSVIEQGIGQDTIQFMSEIKSNQSSQILDTYIQNAKTIEVASSHKILKPAFVYLNEHKNEMVSLNKIASICHISSSYFSRLFAKEIGENYSSYVSKLKVQWAKNLLENTDRSILEISEDLGFNEAGYFIKIFKKYEGITPLLYRKYFKEH
jgi:Predicted sensor domain